MVSVIILSWDIMFTLGRVWILYTSSMHEYFSWFSIALPQHHGSQDMSLSLLVASRLVFIALNDLGSECGQTKGNWNWFGLVKYNGYAMEHGTVIRLPCEMWFHHRIRILRLPFHFSFGWASADISGCCSYIFRASSLEDRRPFGAVCGFTEPLEMLRCHAG